MWNSADFQERKFSSPTWSGSSVWLQPTAIRRGTAVLVLLFINNSFNYRAVVLQGSPPSSSLATAPPVNGWDVVVKSANLWNPFLSLLLPFSCNNCTREAHCGKWPPVCCESNQGEDFGLCEVEEKVLDRWFLSLCAFTGFDSTPSPAIVTRGMRRLQADRQLQWISELKRILWWIINRYLRILSWEWKDVDEWII